jgi:formylglycine-generating enzyme required for sulfatase activity
MDGNQSSVSQVRSAALWQQNSQGQALVIVRGPVKFVIGSPEDEPYRSPVEMQRVVEIPRSFSISATEVTVEQYLRFRADHEYEAKYCPEPDCPVLNVSWFDAAKYCRWLSEKEGIAEDQMCYPPIDQIDPEREIRLPEDLLQRTGYRLPTGAEWEYTARAGARTSRCYGEGEELLAEFAWYRENSSGRSQPVARLKPNALGLFDVHGNALEWCHDWYFEERPAVSPSGVLVDGADRRAGIYRELRGGLFMSESALVRLADRDFDVPAKQSYEIGFRVARTLPDSTIQQTLAVSRREE